MAELYGPILKTIPVGSELGWFAADAALIHTANSNLEHTKLWVSLAIREANIDERALQKWNEIDFLAPFQFGAADQRPMIALAMMFF